MPYSDYRPDLMGTATLEPSGAFEAGSLQSFILTYTAGCFGIDDTGSIKIGFRFATDFGPAQLDDPQGQGYTTAEASNGAVLELKWEFKRNIRPWSRSLYIGVAKHFLRPGDTITVRFGDRRFGSPGIRLQTYAERCFEFHVLVDAIATYDYVPLPVSPSIEVVPGAGVSWHAILPTRVRRGEPFRLAIKADDKWGNPSNRIARTLHLSSAAPIVGLPSTLTFEPGAFAAIADGLVAERGGVIEVCDENGDVLCRSNPFDVIEGHQLRHYWGDLHGQSNETLGTNSADDYFCFGRDKAFLDVMGHQGNDFQITGSFWRHLNDLTSDFDEPGRFVCIPGYEWSANTAVGGDRNVFFRHEGEQLHRSSHAQINEGKDREDAASDAHTAGELFQKLTQRDCVVMAHVGGRYADILMAHDPVLETAVEVHSAWGTFEWMLQDAFEANYRVGVVCNSDGHKGRPGACYPGASFFGSQGGLTCFVTDRLDRDAIFEAMRRRHHYGTTGNRMILEVAAVAAEAEIFRRDPQVYADASSVRGTQIDMGDIARVMGETVELRVRVVGSAPIERVDIFDAERLVECVRPYGKADLGARVRLLYQGAEYRGRARTTNWDGELKVEGNEIVRAEVINNWNLDRGLQDQSSTRLAWKAVTTGNFGAIDIWLRHGLDGCLSFETRHARGRRAIEALGYDRHIFSAGGLDRAVKLYRLPERMTETTLDIRRRVALREKGDTRIYVRVTQEDGHKAWSSPIYLFR
ncbi:MAG: DUF3604 domain-containing protein [Hyphomicrobiaceae bacterium]